MIKRKGESLSKSTTPANCNSKAPNKSGGGDSLIDNRSEAVSQRTLQTMAKEHTDRLSQSITKNPNETGLPDKLKAGVEQLSGYSMDDVRVHYNSHNPEKLNAHAYAQGNQIHLAPGQEKHLPHEAWHVVQQKQGRVKPTMQMKDKVNVNDDAGLEREADVMGQKAQSVVLEPTESIQKSPKKANISELLQLKNYPKDSAGSISDKIDSEFDVLIEMDSVELQNKVIEITMAAEESAKSGGFRIGSYKISEEQRLVRIDNPPQESHGMKPLPEQYNKDVDKFAAPLTHKTMIQAGQWKYLMDNWDQIAPHHDVIIDVDCQFNRTQGQVGFHKDSRGTTAFVNLTYSNTEEMIGPEYYEDLDGDPGLEKQLPDVVQADIRARREGAEKPNNVKYDKLGPFARFSFSDPNLYHTTPLLGSRHELDVLDSARSKFFKKDILRELGKDEHLASEKKALEDKSGFMQTRGWKKEMAEYSKKHPSKQAHGHHFEKISEVPLEKKFDYMQKAKTRQRRLSQDLSDKTLDRQNLKDMAQKPRTFVRSWVRMVPKKK